MKHPLILALVASSSVTAVTAAGLAARAALAQEEPFPHERHQGLFPLCTGCHQGIPTGESARTYPEASACVGCHDGVERERVSWSGPAGRVDNVDFQHDVHDARLASAGDPALSCTSCHNEQPTPLMAVSDSIQLDTCWSCHAHAATEHQVDGDCVTCHVPLSESGFGRERIAALPAPTDHESESFLLVDHGASAVAGVARCATCHTRERCVTCHVDPALDPIPRMPEAPLELALPPAEARYEEPTTHGDQGWLSEHGLQASRSACATCHTSDDCTSCHVQPAPAAVTGLPDRSTAIAPGVGLTPTRPESHERAFFLEAHPSLSIGDEASCATCHRESFCVDCHDGAGRGGYHPSDFQARHAGVAFGRDAECSNCHNSAVFCRACHVEAGLVGTGPRLGDGYHAGGALWLLRHGRAARLTLESCSTCHQQKDCTRCHGVLGSFSVSPHTTDFDAARAWSRSPRACLGCHIGNPLNGGEP